MVLFKIVALNRKSMFLFFYSLLIIWVQLLAAADPKPEVIVSAWAKMSGGKSAKLAYWQSGKIKVMNLKTGEIQSIADHDMSTCAWSPNGKKLAVQKTIESQGPMDVTVMNEDGSNAVLIWQGSWLGEGKWGFEQRQIGWLGDDWIVYSQISKVVRTQIGADNKPIATHTININGLSKPDYQNGSFQSISGSGDYISVLDFWGNRNHGGWHRSMIVNWKTGAVRDLVPRNKDACAPAVKSDGSGWAIDSREYHSVPAYITNSNNEVVDRLGGIDGNPVAGMRWAMGDAEYITHNGEEYHSSQFMAWIRKVSDKSHVYLGSSMWRPVLWIGDVGSTTKVATPVITPAAEVFSGEITITISCATSGAEIYYTTDGSNPTTTSTKYNGPFKLTSSATIKAIAYKAGMEASDVAQKSYTNQQLRSPENPQETVPGLGYRYFEGSWTSVPNFNALSAKKEGISATFDISSRARNDNFGFSFTGYINIGVDGQYTFFVNCDGGAKLYIGNTVLVDHDGARGSAQEKSASIGLKAGKHAIRLDYYSATGSEALTVSWQGPGITKQAIAATALFRPGVEPTVTVKILTPNGGEVFRLGDQVPISWEFSNAKAYMVEVNVTTDGGKTFSEPLVPQAVINEAGKPGSTVWTIPKDAAFLSENAKIRVKIYQSDIMDMSDKPFRICDGANCPSPVIHHRANWSLTKAAKITIDGTTLVYQGEGRIIVTAFDGRNISLPIQQTANQVRLDLSALGRGIYFFQIQDNQKGLKTIGKYIVQ